MSQRQRDTHRDRDREAERQRRAKRDKERPVDRRGSWEDRDRKWTEPLGGTEKNRRRRESREKGGSGAFSFIGP